MEATEIKSMRIKQMVVSNAIIITVFIAFFSMAKIFTISFTLFYLVVAVLILIQALYRIIKSDSTKSLIPIYEKVAVYEKQKLGGEWNKQRKAGNITSLILSAIFLLNALVSWGSPSNFSEIDALLLCLLCLFIIIVINISMLFHINKIDSTKSQQEFKGYTWKSHLIGTFIGVLLSFVILTFIIAYAMATIT